MRPLYRRRVRQRLMVLEYAATAGTRPRQPALWLQRTDHPTLASPAAGGGPGRAHASVSALPPGPREARGARPHPPSPPGAGLRRVAHAPGRSSPSPSLWPPRPPAFGIATSAPGAPSRTARSSAAIASITRSSGAAGASGPSRRRGNGSALVRDHLQRFSLLLGAARLHPVGEARRAPRAPRRLALRLHAHAARVISPRGQS